MFQLMVRCVRLLALSALCFMSYAASAQEYQLKGTILDKENKAALFGVNLLLVDQKDTTDKKFASTDFDGNFTFSRLHNTSYTLNITYIGYQKLRQVVKVENPIQSLGVILLASNAKKLNEVVVVGQAVVAVQKGDTSQFNASSYKTNPDANAEDLISKMPGITSSNGTVKANGEDVKQVLVDGKAFFGDDATMALKNLPADVIDKIQVFDKLSDQAQFTGFDDGQSTKTINIVTKSGRSNGQFGKLYAGYGENDRYISGGNINLFKGQRRFSLLGLSNNINQQNFAAQDLTGVSSGGGSRRGGGGRGNSGRGGGDPENFLVGQQGGITQTHAAGLNYSDNWGKRIKVTGSYFFNRTDNDNITSLTRNYIVASDSGLLYKEYSLSSALKNTHRFNMRLEYTIDSTNSIVYTPKINFQNNVSNSGLTGSSIRSENITESKTENSNTLENATYTISNNILYRHKFQKPGRTISINLGSDINNKMGDGRLNSLNAFNQLKNQSIIDQRSEQESHVYAFSSGLNYTEPLDSSSQLQLTYNPSMSRSDIDKYTHNRDTLGGFSVLDTSLSNVFKSEYMSHNAGISYRRRTKKYNFSAGANFQYATLTGDQAYPLIYAVDKSFKNILPNARYVINMTQARNLRFTYRTSTNAPSISQLQNVVDNRNALLLSTGNPDLKQDYTHAFNIRFGNTNTEKSTGLFIFLYTNYVMDYIGNSTLIAAKDTVLNEGIILKKGSQLTKPVNLDGYASARSFLTYALPVKLIKSNFNINTGFNFNRIPAMINGSVNLANNYNLSQGVGVSSNISEKLDFNLSYTANYSIVKNTLQTGSDNNYFFQTTSFKLNWLPWGRLLLNTSVDNTVYRGLSTSFNQAFTLWNAAIGYKFFKDKSLEVKGSVFDILNQNNSINRTVTETYIEDSRTNILNQYFMVTATYTMKNFKAAPKKKQDSDL